MSTIDPRILIQSGCYELDNLGDQSMLQTAVGRIRERLPNARVAVVSRSPGALRAIAPNADTVPVENRTEWKWVRSTYLAMRRALPGVDPFLRRRFPSLFDELLRLKARRLVNHDALRQTDFMLLSGGGYFTDVFPGQAWSSLERIKAAMARGIGFAIVGHGLGPLRDPRLLDAASDLLPAARLITLRERTESLALLQQFGVSEDRIVVTGDDSIEQAWQARKEIPGSALGVNMRVAPYAGMTHDDVGVVRDVLRGVVPTIQAELVPIPVCIVESVESASDAKVAAHLTEGLPLSAAATTVPTTVESLIERISNCRVTVTGSYHGAVFALSQGIPAVCVENSEYYRIKFDGLVDLFGTACKVVSRSDENFESRLSNAVLDAWSTADEWRPSLLDAAARQVDEGRSAYDRLTGIIETEYGAVREEHPELVA